MSRKPFFALLGFLFVAAWITLSFGDAILCLLGAALFYAIGAVLEGAIDLGDIQARMRTQQRQRG